MAKRETKAVVTPLRDSVKAGLSQQAGHLTAHIVDSAAYNGHGHLQGRQGPKGHDMPANENHLQADAHIPRGVVSRLPQNVQNTWSNGDQGMDDASTENYGKVDQGD